MLENIDRLRGSKDELIKELVDFYDKITMSPFYDGYVGVLATINNLNDELKSGVVTIESGSDDADKAFERSYKYITDMKIYYDQLEYLRNQMSPEKIKEADIESADLLDQARARIKEKK